MKFNRFKKFFYNRKTLLGFVGFFLLFSFTITSLISYLVTSQSITNNLKNESLPLVSDNIFSEIQQDLITPIENSSLMANDEFLINWVLSGEQNKDEIIRYLHRIIERYDYFSAFYVSEITQNYYYHEGILKQISPGDEHDIWYYKFRESGLDYDLDVDTNEAAQGKLTIFINHRLEDSQGNFLGVTGIGLEMNSIGKTLQEYQRKYSHQVYMIDSAGLIQVHSNQDWVETININDLPGMDKISSQILSNHDGTDIYEYKADKKEIILSTRYFSDFEWFLIVEQDKSISLKTARKFLYVNLVIGGLISLLVTLLIMVIINLFSKRLEALATNDPLTGLFNRRKFQELFERELGFAKRYQQPIGILFMDIDNFKSVNDEFGHTIGDKLLKTISEVISAEIREVDVVARWGGEEFSILLHNTNIDDAYQAAERIRHAVEKIQIDTGHTKIYRTISIGVASSSANQVTMESILKQADQALLKAKRSGKNKTCKSD